MRTGHDVKGHARSPPVKPLGICEDLEGVDAAPGERARELPRVRAGAGSVFARVGGSPAEEVRAAFSDEEGGPLLAGGRAARVYAHAVRDDD